MKKIICPYCEQDWVRPIILKNNAFKSLKFSMCMECDTIWTEGEDIVDGMGKNFEDFYSSFNLKADWSEIVDLTKST